jgi:hypothetical protein
MQMKWVESAVTSTARTVKIICTYRYSLCIISFVDACDYSFRGFLLHLTEIILSNRTSLLAVSSQITEFKVHKNVVSWVFNAVLI